MNEKVKWEADVAESEENTTWHLAIGNKEWSSVYDFNLTFWWNHLLWREHLATLGFFSAWVGKSHSILLVSVDYQFGTT